MRHIAAAAIAALATATTFIAGLAAAEAPHRLSGWASRASTLHTPGPFGDSFATPSLGVVPPYGDGQPIPRWSFFGPAAVIELLYLVALDVTDAGGILQQRLLVDLLALSDPLDIGGELEGVSARERFSFPFNSIEAVVLLDEHTLGVAIDDNYPGDAGRRAGTPDDVELIRIRFEQQLSTLSTAP